MSKSVCHTFKKVTFYYLEITSKMQAKVFCRPTLSGKLLSRDR